jgi:CRISPR type I-E-associated protein CasA/Cse1
MNLLHDQWIGAIRADGGRVKIAPWQMSDPRYLDVAAPRPDFKGALVQFLIGLLQTVCPPETTEDWAEWWEAPPDPETLKARLAGAAEVFELDSEGAAFMQDRDLPEAERTPIAALLIESPGGKTIRDKLDHFVKRGQVNAMCRHCVAAALFTLQTNAQEGRQEVMGGPPHVSIPYRRMARRPLRTAALLSSCSPTPGSIGLRILPSCSLSPLQPGSFGNRSQPSGLLHGWPEPVPAPS